MPDPSAFSSEIDADSVREVTAAGLLRGNQQGKNTTRSEMNASSKPSLAVRLRQRAEMLREIRRFFDDRGFIEVQPPCLSRDCVVDAFLDPIEVESSQVGLFGELDSPTKFYLQTSPESAMKRLLAEGAPSIYAITPVFRKGETGARHNVEFSMLEWYEVGGDAASAIELLGNLAVEVLQSPSFKTVTYRDTFAKHLGFDPIEIPIVDLHGLVDEMDSSLAESIGLDRDALLDVLLSERIEPVFANDTPTILTRYPLTQAALAKPCQDDPQCAERFELFYRGVELANGYDELLDADELKKRYEHNNQIRMAHGRPALAVETTLLRAMRQGLPACSGVALGIDRLLMLRVDAHSIEDVVPLPTTRA
ncbi:EF-P lysine aminoacylase EpmA [Rhodopirellula baltica]|uniref:Lysyl-tRNA synthetase family protein n=1 Tax=Rhodopirellula baltica WH47 TaxID=991778 RepID=F2AVG2_RHOBT|nr:EF-P lysine aminoacylase EpmA [Rhodopirellula baltica]EGF26320.1 lysyl-tRNA synthetase family protein [Rhodopirellula baltica WH47]